MADTSLVFNILAKDKASKAFDKIKGAAAAAFAVGAAAAVAFGKSAIDAAANLAETQSKVGVLFGSSAGQVEAFAATAAKSLGQSKQSAMDAAATFAVFGKGAGLAGQNLVKFSTDLTGLASDMASFSNTSPEDAIEAIGSALKGESDPIQRYGILLNESTIAARAFSMGLVKAEVDTVKVKGAQIALTGAQQKLRDVMKDGNATSLDRAKAQQAVAEAEGRLKDAMGGSLPQLTAQQKVLATQGEIFAQTTAAQGDFARTSKGLANQSRIMKAQLSNVTAELGTKLLPAALKVTSWAIGAIDWMKKHSGLTKTLVAVLGTFAAIIGTIIGVTKIWTIVQTALNIVMALNPIGLVILAIAALIAIVVLIATKTTWFQTIWRVAWGAIKGAAMAVWNWIKGNWPLLLAILTGPIGLAVLFIVRKWDLIVGFVKKLPGRISSAASGMWDGIKNAFRAAINWLIGKWNGLEFRIPSISFLGQTIGGFTLGVPDIPYLAHGGSIIRSGMAVVGERGPELVSLSRGAQVTPLGAAAGTVQIIVNVPPTANMAEVGRVTVEAIQAYERRSGKRWRL